MKTLTAIGILIILVIILSESENRKKKMEEKRKRPCEFTHPDDPRSPKQPVKGLFHQFGTATSLGQPAITVAIVEDENGRVWKIDPERIQFTDK